MDHHATVSDSEPCYLRDIGGVLGPSPQVEGAGVFLTQQRRLDVVVTGVGHQLDSNFFCPRVQTQTIQAEAAMELHVNMVQAHMPDADVEVAQVEVSAVDGGIVIVAMLKDDDEIFRVVLGN